MSEEDTVNVITKQIGGNWLTNGHLQTCILKLGCPSTNEYTNDTSRVENIAHVTRLFFSNEEDEGILAEEFAGYSALVLAPELAFGSPDFDTLDNLIKSYKGNIIFICGFGFSDGSALRNITSKSHVEGIWNSKLNDKKRYNGGWVWVKTGNSIKCYIFLKNYLEQTSELTVGNLKTGDQILRLDGNDIIIFPLICADLISNEISSPRNRIVNLLNSEGTGNKKLLITGSLLNTNSSSGYWKQAIGDLLDQTKASRARLLLCNCINPKPEKAEEKDKWRCLSGVFQHREGCKAPSKALPNIRYVDDTKFAGLVLRNTVISSAFGRLRWTNSSSEGLHSFSECSLYIWSKQSQELIESDCNCAADELHRFLLRNKGNMLHDVVNAKDENKVLADNQIEGLLKELAPGSGSNIRKVANELFTKCLKGIVSSENSCPDRLHADESNLTSALTVIKLIQLAVDASLLPVCSSYPKLEYGQLLLSDVNHEVLVWDSQEYTASQLFNKVREDVVKEGGSARPLTIIGKGRAYGSLPKDGRINSGRLSDISNAAINSSGNANSEDLDICESRDRVVYWKNQSAIDDALITTEGPEDLKLQISREVTIRDKI